MLSRRQALGKLRVLRALERMWRTVRLRPRCFPFSANLNWPPSRPVGTNGEELRDGMGEAICVLARCSAASSGGDGEWRRKWFGIFVDRAKESCCCCCWARPSGTRPLSVGAVFFPRVATFSDLFESLERPCIAASSRFEGERAFWSWVNDAC